MARFTQLQDWLSWLEQLHPKAIDLGLQRVYSVASNLNLLKPSTSISHEFSGAFNSDDINACPTVVTIAGTNGKGSCVSVLEQALVNQKSSSKACVGSYTSPHLHHFCERIRIDQQPVSEALVCDAFADIDRARGDISLTYFEFGTLAALWIFARKNIPYILLEVGLGGKLDAVNIVDADIAVVTSIDIDHEDWLGSDRNIISQEKLGVARTGRPLIIAEANMTPALKLAAEKAECLLIDRDFSLNAVENKPDQWHLKYGEFSQTLPLPSLPLPSVAAAIIVLDLLKLMPDEQYLEDLMGQVGLSGRFQKVTVNGQCVIYDVAHNPAAAIQLAKRLTQQPSIDGGKTLAVMAVMSDKDHNAIFEPLYDVIDDWYLGDLLDNPRAAKALDLKPLLDAQQCHYSIESTIEEAFHKANTIACGHDRIIVFGSFYTVAAIQSLTSRECG